MNRKIHYLDLEGLAINGLLTQSILEDCENVRGVRKSKIIAETLSGERIETDCIEYERLVRIWIILKQYEKWSRDFIERVSEEILEKEETES
ncbi:MAG: hypothetical protein ABWJ42_01010 [Sulfolobales archaeon]